MNNDINIMIQLQNIWDKVLAGKDVIRRSENSIEFWKKNLNEKRAEVAKYEELLIKFKKNIKEKEIDLAELETHYAKTEERLKLVKSERELEAQKHEHEKIAADKDAKEELLINIMDELDETEKKLEKLKNELEESENQVDADIRELKSKIVKEENDINENQSEFDTLLEDLSPEYSSRFQKLLNSKNGRGVGKVEGDICSSCNFKIPASLATESSMDEKAVSCTNCGRFIYRID